MNDFDVLTIPLKDSNLIEASAGTGKTFSIGIMVLRLLLEQKIPIREILMVTFTKMAVAELETRIRFFVKSAYQYSLGNEIGEEKIRQIVDAQTDREESQELLRKAVNNLDELSVSTIHGFCQQSLTEFAFETDQLFGAELIESYEDLLGKEVNNFWRKEITVLETKLLKLLLEHRLSRSDIKEIVSQHLNGKKYFFYKEDRTYHFKHYVNQDLLNQIDRLIEEIETAQQDLEAFYTTQKASLRQEVETSKINGNVKKAIFSRWENFQELLNYVSTKMDKDGFEIFGGLIQKAKQSENSATRLTQLITEILHQLYSYSIQEINSRLNRQKETLNLISYEDMISKMANALEGPRGQILATQLRQKFKAVFIDEFQDTDREQYQIFSKAFQNNPETILFYIGDPKQSIYGWRKADIFTYFKARNSVDNRYTMNTNYRSNPSFVQGLNYFFQLNPDPFGFGEVSADQGIKFIPVNANPVTEEQAGLFFMHQIQEPFQISNQVKKGNIAGVAAQLVLQLLANPNYMLLDKNHPQGKKVRPSDIGLLVRTNSEAHQIKSALSALKIPSVTMDDQQIFESIEAKNLVTILEAFSTPSIAAVNKALLTPFIGWDIHRLRIIDQEQMIGLFRNFGSIWKERGIFPAIKAFINQFNIQNKLQEAQLNPRLRTDTERMMANLTQLQELLSKTETRQQLKMTELLSWFKRHYTDDLSDDETVQRIESDEEAVQILTIHKSKGLEFPIVIAPYLDMKENPESLNGKSITFRGEDGNYYLIKGEEATKEQTDAYWQQRLQENRRLLYVALTRAKYNCFIFRAEKDPKTSLSAFTNKIDAKDQETGLFKTIEITEDKNLFYKPTIPPTQSVSYKLTKANPLTQNQNWRLMSYTGLAAEAQFKRPPSFEGEEENYDRFIFRDLGKGRQIGTFLHQIMEQLDFSRSEDWEKVLGRNLRYFDGRNKGKLETFLPQYLHEVLDCVISTENGNFKLSEIKKENCLHEMEFEKLMGAIAPQDLAKIPEALVKVKINKRIQGPLIGFVDLFFEHEGRYYILDWKSNYLGPTLADYDSKAIKRAMDEHNYHLQYLLYTYALKQYLEGILGNDFDYKRDFGGVLYVFLRGVRKDQNTGIFFTKPTIAQLEAIQKAFGE